MNRSVLLTSLGVMGICFYVAFGLWQSGKARTLQIEQITRHIEIAQNQAKELEPLPSSDLAPVESVVRQFYEISRRAAVLSGAKFQMQKSTAASRFRGVDALAVKLSFSDLGSFYEQIRILKMLRDLQKTLPVEIRKIEGSDEAVEITMDMFGDLKGIS